MRIHSRLGRVSRAGLAVGGWLALGLGASRGDDAEPAVALEQEVVVEEFDEETMVIDEFGDEPLVEIPLGEIPPPAEGPGLFGAGLRMLFDAIAPAAGPVPGRDAAPVAANPQQREQIRQHARQLEQVLQPALRTELDVIRRACGDLPREARQTVLAAGRAAVTKSALEVATLQMTGGDRRRLVEPRLRITDALAEALEPLAAPEAFAAYRHGQRLRQERREAAARVAIVSKLDRRLDLTAAQRGAIEADLTEHWDPEWVRELDDRGIIMNNERPCPDYAAACIEPHLREEQRADWARWRKAAGSAVIGIQGGVNLESLGLHVDDDWWTK